MATNPARDIHLDVGNPKGKCGRGSAAAGTLSADPSAVSCPRCKRVPLAELAAKKGGRTERLYSELPADPDEAARLAVQRLGTTEAVFHGQVPPLVLQTLYRLAPLLSSQVLLPATGHAAPSPSISVEKLPRKQLAHYKYGRDGLGLRFRVAMNVIHLNKRTRDIVGTLCHELLHGVQELHGSPGKNNYHNAEFISWSVAMGLPSDEQGCSSKGITKDGLLDEFLKSQDLPEYLIEAKDRKELPKGKGSKLKKWSCKCEEPVNVRVAIPDFKATCDHCEEPFTLQE
jgi:hypothetical protein